LTKLASCSSKAQDFVSSSRIENSLHQDEDEGLDVREAVLRPLSRLLAETQRFVKEPECDANFYGRGLEAYFDSDGFVASVGAEHGYNFISALVQSQSFAHLVQRMVEMDENDRGSGLFF